MLCDYSKKISHHQPYYGCYGILFFERFLFGYALLSRSAQIIQHPRKG